jgi:hypothetical protein
LGYRPGPIVRSVVANTRTGLRILRAGDEHVSAGAIPLLISYLLFFLGKVYFTGSNWFYRILSTNLGTLSKYEQNDIAQVRCHSYRVLTRLLGSMLGADRSYPSARSWPRYSGRSETSSGPSEPIP